MLFIYVKLITSMNKLNLIDGFQGEYRWLSNFWIHDTHRGLSVEHLYQAAKTTNINDWLLVMAQDTPAKAKRVGREIVVRADWERVKLVLMEQFVREKFALNMELRQKLLATRGIQIVESNTWGDSFWGVYDGFGLNHLGKILMKVRDEFLDVSLSY